MDRKSVPLGFYVTLASLILVLSSIFSCGKPPQKSSTPESVEIDQSPVKNQYSIGFCWAYATLGLLESNYRVKTGQIVNLSEEALGYAHMREELFNLAAAYQRGNISLEQAINATQGQRLEGWFVRSYDSDLRLDAMELIDDYGVIPEDEWSLKFTSPSDVERLKSVIASPFRTLLMSGAPVTRQSIDSVLTTPGAFPSTPPESITIDGQTMTPQEFSREKLGFHSEDYVAIFASSAAEGLSLIQTLKRTLGAGYSVPLSFAVSFDNLQNGSFTATNYPASNLDANPQLVGETLHVSGGHAVLVTDFVNVGGREGEIPSVELRAEIAKNAEQLNYIKLKNSWGARPRTNESGVIVSSSEDGYYRMDLGYIKASSALHNFGIVVPRSFAE